METDIQINFSFQEILAELEIEADQILSAENADVVAMSCCNKTDGACWTQM